MEQIENIVKEIDSVLDDAYAKFQEMEIAQVRYAIDEELKTSLASSRSFDRKAKLV